MTTLNKIVEIFEQTPFGEYVRKARNTEQAVANLCCRRTFFYFIKMDYSKPDFELIRKAIVKYIEENKNDTNRTNTRQNVYI